MKNKSFLISCLLACLCASASFAQSRRAPVNQPPAPPPPPVATDSKPSGIQVDAIGDFDGPVYTNKDLGFTLTLTQGWQAQDIDVRQRFAESASQNAPEMTKDPSAAEASAARSALLFIVIKPTEGIINPNVTGLTEDIALAFNVRTPRQYIESMRRVVAEDAPIVFDEQITTEQINGIEFGVIGAGPRNPETSPVPNVRQRYYITLRKNRALVFILTYVGAEQLQACLEVINSLKFQ